ncbi:MAG: DUF3784 domain-containing protein [Defluviitaleaceae bacterium]|nr:DUF3784 domain-containing protein [Defluviitaleaceae bacterium]
MILFTIISASIAVLFAIIGLLWFFGKGANMMNSYNVMDPARKALIDEKAFLRFNGKVTLIVALVIGVCAALYHFGHTWAMTVVFAAVLVMVAVNLVSMRSKRFRKKDESGELIEAAKPTEKQARERKMKIIFSVVATVVITIPVLWLVFQGGRDIRVDFQEDAIVIRGLYGETIEHSQISSVELLSESMTEIGTGGRRMGHGTTNNLRGRFGAGQLHIQYPQEGPTIRINRINGTAVFISLPTPEQTIELYNDIIDALR